MNLVKVVVIIYHHCVFAPALEERGGVCVAQEATLFSFCC
jgi:hypothetical protein